MAGIKAWLSEFVDSYVDALIVLGTDSKKGPLDDRYGPQDVHPESWVTAEKDCVRFASEAESDVMLLDPGEAGWRFGLARNGHNPETGIWLGATEDATARLNTTAQRYGRQSLREGDDGKLYVA